MQVVDRDFSFRGRTGLLHVIRVDPGFRVSRQHRVE
jgi:hypothetical protein